MVQVIKAAGVSVLEHRKVGVLLLLIVLGCLWGYTGWAEGVYRELTRAVIVYLGAKSLKDAVIGAAREMSGVPK